MALPVSFDHCVIHVSDWERSNAFYRDVLGAELVRRPSRLGLPVRPVQLNLHGPGFKPAEVARLPVQPGNSDLCFEWNGPIADAVAHLESCNVPIHAGPIERFGAKGRGHQRLFPRSRRLAARVHLLSSPSRRTAMTIHARSECAAGRASGAAGRRRDAPPRRDEAAGAGARGDRRVGGRSVEACRPHRGLRLSAHRRARAGAAGRLGCDPRRARLHAAIVLVPRPFRRAEAARRRARVRPVDAGHRLSARGGRAAASAVPGPVRRRPRS